MSERIETDLGLLPKEWSLVSLGDFLYIKGRIGWKGLKRSEYLSEGYAIINGEQIKSDEIDWTNVGRISKERYDESPEIMLKKDDILMTKDGTIGKIAYVEELIEPATVASGVFVIRQISDKLNQRYLYNYFSSHFFKWLIKSRIEGSVIPHLYQRDFQEMLIPLPTIWEQETIAGILYCLTKKIKLLQQQNQSLEELAQTLFKRWFVEFEFPFDFAQGKPKEHGEPYKSSGGRMVDSELGEIPEDWRVGELIELLEKIVDNRGKTPPLVMEKKFLMLETYQMSSRTTFLKFDSDNKKKHVSEETYNNWFRAGHPKYLDILFATVGNGIPNWCFMPKNDNQFCIAQNLVAIRAKKEIGGVYLKYFFDTNYFTHTCKGIIITTAQPSIKLAHLKQLEVLIPIQNLITTYNDLVLPMVNQISNNSDEIQTLTQLRNTLLPKLMSGELRIKQEAITN